LFFPVFRPPPFLKIKKQPVLRLLYLIGEVIRANFGRNRPKFPPYSAGSDGVIAGAKEV
jgi:hypothetical protein